VIWGGWAGRGCRWGCGVLGREKKKGRWLANGRIV
jgi:hypothetical protein